MLPSSLITFFFSVLFKSRYFIQILSLFFLFAFLYSSFFFRHSISSSFVIQGAFGFLLVFIFGIHSSTAANSKSFYEDQFRLISSSQRAYPTWLSLVEISDVSSRLSCRNKPAYVFDGEHMVYLIVEMSPGCGLRRARQHISYR